MKDAVLAEGTQATKRLRPDVIAFGVTFASGLFTYLALHFAHVPQIFVTSAVVGIMVAYALIVAKIPRLRMRLDQAGDNAYYLGLLFTLISMALALYEFGIAVDSELGVGTSSGARQIIANFGVALASTITGIFLRIILHQMRVDPADVENMTRIELADSSQRVKATLNKVTDDMALFHEEIRQKTGDVVNFLLKSVGEQFMEFSHKVSESSIKVLDSTENAQASLVERSRLVAVKMDEAAESARQAMENLRAVEPPPLKLATRLEKVSAAIEGLSTELGEWGSRFKVIEDEWVKCAAANTLSTERVLSLADHLNVKLANSGDRFSNAMDRAGHSMRDHRELFNQMEVQSRAIAEQVEKIHVASQDGARALARATHDMTALLNGRSAPADSRNVRS